MNRRTFIAQAAVGALASVVSRTTGAATRVRRPNLLLVLADDLGYSDLGCFGGEIRTPNLDRLASGGLRLTQFYNCGVCVPTRGALMTGRYPHEVGCGEEWGPLRRDVATLAEVLRGGGYGTWLSGKWHLGDTPELLPTARGFQRYFGPLGGTANYFASRNPRLLLDEKPYSGPADSFYLTDAITDHALEFARAAIDASEPFFGMVTYTAPHFPLHARPEDIARYRGTYRAGWEALRTARRRRMLELGLIRPEWGGGGRSELAPDVAWERLTDFERDQEDLRMAVYAAQVERMDRGVGRILDELERRRVLDNTVVVFLSDNGACAAKLRETPAGKRAHGIPAGPAESYDAYGLPWASASNTPFRLYKSWLHEGGIATPFIVRGPGVVAGRGEIRPTCGHVIDLLPTFLEVAGMGSHLDGDSREPREGASLVPAFANRPFSRRHPLCWHQWGGAAVRDGDWKLVRLGTEAATNRLRRYGYSPAQFSREWELFDLATDRTEQNDLAARHPAEVERLSGVYDAWVRRTRLDPSKVRTDM